MPERIEWLDDGSPGGSPFSPRFGDRYRSELGGLEQARDVFLAGCGLPALWRSKAQWCVLETGFGLALNFLVTWLAWKSDPLRPRILHFVSTEAYPASSGDVVRGASAHPALLPLARELSAQMWGLLPGFHRLSFEDGHVLLTLCIGDAKAMLRQQSFEADSVYLDGFSPQKNPDIWDVHTFKSVARCCRRGTRIATWTVSRSVRDALFEAGFIVARTPGVPPKRDNLLGEYNPSWTPKRAVQVSLPSHTLHPLRCVVIGAGLAGAASAASLVRRGWQVTVLDAADQVAAGASGLPAGLMAPHVSPDDGTLSKLSRSGLRQTITQVRQLLCQGMDWAPSGAIQRRPEAREAEISGLPTNWLENFSEAAADWVQIATAEQLEDAGLDALEPSYWYPKAAWVKPASLVKAWLAMPGIHWQGNCKVASLRPTEAGWQAVNAREEVIAEAPVVILAAAYGTQQLLDGLATLDSRHTLSGAAAVPILQATRGQVSWARHGHTDQDPGNDMPRFPVNGNGSLIPDFPSGAGRAWLAGASYERGVDTASVTATDHESNLERLRDLVPQAVVGLARDFDSGAVKGWSGVRCATPGRLPLLGQIVSHAGGQVWAATAMGSRGLTFAALCGELLAAHLNGEPLPIEKRLAEALWP